MFITNPGYLNKIVTLNEGVFVATQPIKPDDVLGLQTLLSRLSAEGTHFRFLEYQ